jgi:hypothetical protein
MPGARCTRGLVCKFVRRNAHEHTGSAETLRHSLRNGFTAYSALSPATNSFCHRHRRIKVLRDLVGLAKTSADLAPATGARTTRLRRTQPVFEKCFAGECTPAEDFAKADLAPFVRTPAARSRVKPALRLPRAPTLPRPPHLNPRS